MIEKKLDLKNYTFISVKSYHKNKNILFNGFICCSRFNPIIYKALKKCYYTENKYLINNYHLFCEQFYKIHNNLKNNQNTLLLNEIKKDDFKEGVKSYYNDNHILTHWCYTKKIKLNNILNNIETVYFEKPIYVSLTSIFSNQNILLKTLKSIMRQSKTPYKIYLYLSEEPYILDNGFKNKKITNINLLNYINNTNEIELRWCKNIGSFRKLIPLLKEKWNNDCFIITIDDDTVYNKYLIENLINDYYKNKCIIGYRGFTPKFNKFINFDYKKKDVLKNKNLFNFLTGKGGILYKPKFFHKTNNLIFNENIYLNICSKQDDIWFYIVRILNNIDCYISNKKYMDIDNTQKKSLFYQFNCNNNNTIIFKKIIEEFKKKYIDYYTILSNI